MKYEMGSIVWSDRKSRAMHYRKPGADKTFCDLQIKRWDQDRNDNSGTCRRCKAIAFPMDYIHPKPGYLSYVPKVGRYCLGTVWGYGFGTDARCTFYIMDCVMGDEMEILPLKIKADAEALRPELMKRVQRMNKEDKLAA